MSLSYLLLDLPEPPLDVVSKVLRRLCEEGFQVALRVLLLEVDELLEAHLGQLLLSDLLEDLVQDLVVALV